MPKFDVATIKSNQFLSPDEVAIIADFLYLTLTPTLLNEARDEGKVSYANGQHGKTALKTCTRTKPFWRVFKLTQRTLWHEEITQENMMQVLLNMLNDNGSTGQQSLKWALVFQIYNHCRAWSELDTCSNKITSDGLEDTKMALTEAKEQTPEGGKPIVTLYENIMSVIHLLDHANDKFAGKAIEQIISQVRERINSTSSRMTIGMS